MNTENSQAEALRDLIDIVDANLSHRIGNFEFDHSERTETQNGTIYLNCVTWDGKTPAVRFKVESISDKGYNLIWNGDIGIDWGARVVLEQSFDAEGNPVNAIIEDNAGVKAACLVSYEGILAVVKNPEYNPKWVVGYAHASGTEPHDQYSDTLLTIGNYCYLISVNRVDFFFYFVNRNVEIKFNENTVTLKTADVESKEVDVILISVVDSVAPEDDGLTQIESDALYARVAKTSALLRT